MQYKVNWKFENFNITYIGSKESIDPIKPILDIQTYYCQKYIFFEFR